MSILARSRLPKPLHRRSKWRLPVELGEGCLDAQSGETVGVEAVVASTTARSDRRSAPQATRQISAPCVSQLLVDAACGFRRKRRDFVGGLSTLLVHICIVPVTDFGELISERSNRFLQSSRFDIEESSKPIDRALQILWRCAAVEDRSDRTSDFLGRLTSANTSRNACASEAGNALDGGERLVRPRHQLGRVDRVERVGDSLQPFAGLDTVGRHADR